MGSRQEIILNLDTINQLIEPCADSPFLKRRLREDAEEFIVERARALPHNAAARLIVRLPNHSPAEEEKVRQAVREHFSFRRAEAEKGFRRTLGFGWRSLLIGVAFLSLTILLVQLIDRNMPKGHFSSLIQGGLTILAWVIFWRPGELLLYEWYPFRRDAKLFRKLEQADIQITVEERVANDPLP